MLKALFNWKVLLNIILAAAAFTFLVWLTFRWLEFHTDHGEEILVPDVTNSSVQDAIKILEGNGLTYTVDSFSFNPKYKPFQVLQIYPSPGSRVKSGSPVHLNVNPKTWAPVAIPDVIDNYKYRAFAKLELLGLKVGDTIYEPSISKDAVLKLLYEGTVVRPGDLVPRFSSIDVVVGEGPRRNVPVPNVVGYSMADAKKIIADNYFEVGLFFDENEKPVSAESSDLIVFYQNPGAGRLSDEGVQIDMWVSTKTRAELLNKVHELDNYYLRNISGGSGYSGSPDDMHDGFPGETPPEPAPNNSHPKPQAPAAQPNKSNGNGEKKAPAQTAQKPAETKKDKPKAEPKPKPETKKPEEKKKVIIE